MEHICYKSAKSNKIQIVIYYKTIQIEDCAPNKVAATTIYIYPLLNKFHLGSNRIIKHKTQDTESHQIHQKFASNKDETLPLLLGEQ